jgi:hypothetical protein
MILPIINTKSITVVKPATACPIQNFTIVCIPKITAKIKTITPRIVTICIGAAENATIFVIDVAEGDKIPRKGGPGITRSDLLVINKIDLAPYVGANLEIMRQDTLAFRDENSFIFTNLKTDEGIQSVISWIKKNCLLEGIS